jgi:hypothetical protein
MSNSGALILFVSLGILIVVSLVAMNDFRANVNDSNPTIKSDANLATDVANPLFTVLAYIALAVAAICLLNTFKISL